jgi:RNA recognition motif-containing protein
MAKKLYVGNLSYDTTEDSLKEAFSAAGAVESVAIIKDKFSGRSRGFAFVEMTNDEDAEKAIGMFNEKDLDGRNLVVNEAKPMTDKPFERKDRTFDRKRQNY